MRDTKALWMVAISLLLGLVAVAVGGKWLMERSTVDISGVIVATRDIDVGTRLTPELLESKDWLRTSTPQGAFQDVKLLDSRVVRVNLTRGEPLLEAKLAPVGTTGGLSGVIAEGKRAITVRVNDVVGVAGFALPGNKVDILINTKDEKEKGISKIVLEQILVLAVAQDVGRDETKPKVVTAVTLEVTPEEAEKLDLARSIGTLSLVLRNQVDTGSGTTEGVRIKDLLKLSTKLATSPAYHRAPPIPQTVEFIRGSQRAREISRERDY